MIHGKTLSAIFVCVTGMGYGIYLFWRGMTGNVLRGRFTGNPVIPSWMYVTGGVALAVMAGLMIVILLKLS